jgi:hypothetical protein
VASFTVQVQGLAKLQHAFLLTDRKLSQELTAGLKKAAEPVRVGAEAFAVARIPTSGFVWSRMRVGVTTGSVYVAPRARGTIDRARRRRPRYGDLLMGRAMQPALKANVALVERIVDETLAKVNGEWARG